MDEVYKTVIYPIFTVKLDGEGNPIRDNNFNYMQYQLQYFARRLAGYNCDKLWGVWQGARNSGKSAFIDFLKKAFGDYIGCPASGLFTSPKFASDDPNKALGWRIDYQYKRLMDCQEQKQDSTN